MPNITASDPRSVSTLKRTCVGAAAGLMAVVGITTSMNLASSTAGTADAAVASAQQKRATAPRFVSGYSYHCSEEMDADNVTGPEVDHVVENYYLSARYDEEEATWRYPGPTLIVVLNNNGFCVTVFRP